MDRDLTREEQFQLEALIDKTDAGSVLKAIGEICLAKANHIAENWQDFETAAQWERLAVTVFKASSEV